MRAYRVRPEVIMDEMGKRGWSQQYLAEQSDLPKETISRILNGHVASPQRRTLEAIADALDLEVTDIVEAFRPLAVA